MIGIRDSVEYTLSSLAFSTFRTLPRRGRIAWKRLSRQDFAVPPAESPSTRYSSVRSARRSLQSASLPGRVREVERALFRSLSLARRAFSRATYASTDLSIISLAVAGFSSRNSFSLAVTTVSTMVRISELPSFAFVWDSNWASGSFTETTAQRPSRTSSPERFLSFSLRAPFLRAYSLMTFVSAALNPVSWVPPSMVDILLAKVTMFSL